MAPNGYTKCFTGAAVLLVLLGVSLCEARLLKSVSVTTVNGEFSNLRDSAPAVDTTSLTSQFSSLMGQILSEQAKNDAVTADDIFGSFGDGKRGDRRLLDAETKTTGHTFVSTTGSGSATTTSKTHVAVSPAAAAAAEDTSGKARGSKGSASTTFTASGSVSSKTVGAVKSGEHIPRSGVEAAQEGGVAGTGSGNPQVETGSSAAAPKKTAVEQIESEVLGSKDAVVSDDPAIVKKETLPVHLSGGEVSIDLGVSTSTGRTRISAGSRTSGRGSASGGLGLSLSKKKPHDALVPVPATAGVGH